MQDQPGVHKQRTTAPGLRAPVEILVDRHGVAHLYGARTTQTCCSPRGFNAAHFPLWTREEYVPLLVSRDAFEAVLERRILLETG